MLYMDTCTTSSIQDIRCIIYEALSKPLDSFPFPRICWVVHSTDFQGLRLGLNTDLGARDTNRLITEKIRAVFRNHMIWHEGFIDHFWNAWIGRNCYFHRCYIEVWMLLFCTAASISSAVLTTRMPSSTSSAFAATSLLTSLWEAPPLTILFSKHLLA